MIYHRDSQKRFYVEHAVCFITTNTYQSHPHFNEPILCDLFLEDLLFCRKIKGFEIYAYKINPDHIHLLLQPDGKYNYSDIIGSLKRNFSRDCNILINGGNFIRKNNANQNTNNEGEDSNPRRLSDRQLMEHIEKMSELQKQFLQKYSKNRYSPRFRWQPSFHDHIIRGKKDFYFHLKYIENQWIKHKLPENRYCFIDESVVF